MAFQKVGQGVPSTSHSDHDMTITEKADKDDLARDPVLALLKPLNAIWFLAVKGFRDQHNFLIQLRGFD